MDRKFIDDHHVVARYLADQLSEQDRQAFEAYCIEHPDIAAELDATAHFKAGLMQLRDTGRIEALLNRPTRSHKPLFATLAAAAVLVVGVGVALRQDPPVMAATPRAFESWFAKPSIAIAYDVLRLRGEQYDLVLERPTSELVELRILPEFEARPARYRVTLARVAADESLQQIAQAEGLLPAADGFVPVFLGSRIETGIYRLLISGAADTDAAARVSTFKLRIR